MYKINKLLVLEGGVDVNPALYGQKPLPTTQRPNKIRDALEFEEVRKAMFDGTSILGICRGAQLLCVAHGGALWQHSLGHNQSHGLVVDKKYTHLLPLPWPSIGTPGSIDYATAGHHQIMDLRNIPKEEYEVIAWCPFPTQVWAEDGSTHTLDDAPEIVWFHETQCLAIQGHPEWAEKNSTFRIFVDKLVFDLLGEKDVFA